MRHRKIKFWISHYCFVWCLLSVSFAAAQTGSIYGLEDEAVIPKPRTENHAITMDEALATMREYRAAAVNNDLEYLVSTLANPRKSQLVDGVKIIGLPRFLGLTKPVHSWDIKCAACWNDESRGQICVLRADLRYASKHNNTYRRGRYVVKKWGM